MPTFLLAMIPLVGSKRRYLALAGGLVLALGLALILVRSPGQQAATARPRGLPQASTSATAARTTKAAASFVAFTPQKDEYALSTDPREPNYDATALVMTMNMRAESLFKREPRDAVWAPQVEKRMDTVLSKDYQAAFPDQEFVVRSQCATSTCLIEVQLPEGLSAAARMAAEAIPQWAGLSTSIELIESDATVRFAVTIAKDRRELADFDRTMAEERWKALGGLAKGDVSQVQDQTFRDAHVYLKRLAP